MDIKRTILYIALAGVAGILWLQWQNEYPAKTTTSATTVQSSQVNASDNTSNNSQNADDNFIPSASSNDSGQHISSSLKSSAVSTVDQNNLIKVKTDVLNINIDPSTGNLVQATLPSYPVSLDEPNTPIQILDSTKGALFQMQSGVVTKDGKTPLEFKAAKQSYTLTDDSNQLTVSLVATSGDLAVQKDYIFTRGKYSAVLKTSIHNKGSSDVSAQWYQQITRQDVPSSSHHIRSYDGAAISSLKTPYEKVSYKDMDTSDISDKTAGGWVGMQQPYFLTAWIPPKDKTMQYYSHVKSPSNNDANIYTIGYISSPTGIKSGSTISDNSTFYIGPEIAKNLKPLANGLSLTVDYGWLSPISSIIFTVMSYVDNIIGNWGWSIILVTLLIKILFYWPSGQSYKSMAKMRAVQPRLAALKDRFADDKAGLSKATMEFYKKEKVNPMGGCLPTILQFPVFFALYYVIIESVQLRQAPFMFWIHDLSLKDPYYILPIIMGGTMLLQQRLTPAPPDPTQAKMMMLMPVVFTFVFLSFPAGLVLYWITNNMLGIAQQAYVMKTYDPKKEQHKKKKKKK